MGAPVGNRNNSKGKPITDELRKAIVQDDWKRVRAGIQRILDGFASGEQWAVNIVMDRMEGKAPATLDVPITKASPLTRVLAGQRATVRPSGVLVVTEA